MLQLAENTCNSTGAVLLSAGSQLGGCQWCTWAWLLQLVIPGEPPASASAPRWKSYLPKQRLLLTRVQKASHISAPKRASHLRLLQHRGVLLIRGEGAVQAGVQEDQALREHGALEGRVRQLQLGQLGGGQVLQVQVADAACRCRGRGALIKMI